MPDSDEKPLVYIVDDEEHITELVAMGLGINDLSPVRLHSSREVLQKIEELSERVKAVLRRSTSCAVSCSPIHGESLRESRSSSASGTTRCRPPRSMSTKVTRARVMRLSSQHSTPRGEATVGSSSARKARYVQLGAGGN